MAWADPSLRAARIAPWFVAAYCLGLGLVGFWPSPVDRPAAGTITDVLRFLHANGVPHWLNYPFIEFSANVLLFVPFGVLLTIVSRPSRWWVSVAIGFAVSVVLEVGQLVLLSERYPSGLDVLANTVGSLIGAFLVGMWRSRPRPTP